MPGGQIHPQTKTQTASNDPPQWYKSPEWVLVIVGIVTAFVIGWQSYETMAAARGTKDAAEATRRNVELQETLNQQWLQISGWRREGFGSRESSPPRFTIAFEISNPTQVPLTVKAVDVRIVGEPTANYEPGNVLAPYGEPVKVTYSYEVKPEWIDGYQKYALPLVVEGVITYVDCFERERTQPFRRACFLGPGSYFSSSQLAPPRETAKNQADKKNENA